MNQLHFNFPSFQSPPDGYRWTSPLGITIKSDNRDLWLRQIRQHCIDNDLPLEDGWQAQAEDTLCRLLPPGLCRYDDGSVAAVTINTRMTAGDWLRGMEVLASVVMDGDALVEQEEAERRARICAACPCNVTLPGCSSCLDMADFITRVNGGAKTEADGKLAQCAVCHCSNRSQVWVKAELLAKGVTPEMREQFDLIPHCWKGEALRALQNSQPQP